MNATPSHRRLLVARVTEEPRAAFETLLVVVGFLFLFGLLPHRLFGDDVVRFSDAEALLHDGHVSDSRYSLVMPLLSAPFLLVGELVRTPEWWAARFNVVVVAIGVLVAMRLLRGHIEPAVARRWLLILLSASFLSNRLRDYNAEVLTTTLFAIGILAVAVRRHTVAGWSALVMGVVNTPAAIAGLAAVSTAESIRTRRLRHLLPVVAAGVLICTEAWLRRGSPFVSGYEGDHGFTTVLPYSGNPGFSYPFVLGVLVIMLSFGRGLVYFAPGLLLWLAPRTRRISNDLRGPIMLMLVAVAGLVLVYAKWWAWYGGIGWGPRFFIFAAVPASLLLALRLGDAGRSASRDALTLAVLAWSAWIGLTGAVGDLSFLSFCVRDDFALEALCWYSPEFSPWWQPVRDFPALTWRTTAVGAYCIVVVAYLGAPLAATIVRRLVEVARSRTWAHGWRL